MKILRLSTLSLTLAIAVMTLGYVNVASAEKPTCPGDHPSCKEAGESGYSVTISMDVIGDSKDNWLGGVGGKKSIGLNDASAGHEVGEFENLNFFIKLPGVSPPWNGTQGENCFLPDSSFTIHQARISRGKGGRAQAGFWFDGKTNDGSDTDVLYALALFGQFEEFKVWPPDNDEPEHVIIMSDWKMIVENEGKEIKSISCIGEGDPADISVHILVTKK